MEHKVARRYDSESIQPRRRPRSSPATNVPLLGKSAVRKWRDRFQIRDAVESLQPLAGLLTETLSSPAAFEMAESYREESARQLTVTIRWVLRYFEMTKKKAHQWT